MMAAAETVAADEIGVLALEIVGREHRAAEDLRPRSPAHSVRRCRRHGRHSFLDLVPVGAGDLALGIARGWRGQHAHLHPENVLAVRRARRIDGGRLADDEDRLGREESGHRLLIGARHHIHRRSEMHIGEALELFAGRQSGRASTARWTIIVPGPLRKLRIRSVDAFGAAAVRQESAEQDLRREIGDHRALTPSMLRPSASVMPVARPPVTVMRVTSFSR